MSEKQLRTTFSHPTPELPVVDVERAQQHYRDALGFEINWLYSTSTVTEQALYNKRFEPTRSKQRAAQTCR